MKPWHKEDAFEALKLRGWIGPVALEYPKDWHYVGEAWSFSRASSTLSLYFVADYGIGFNGADSVESIAGRLFGDSGEYDLWLNRTRDAKWKASLVNWADHISSNRKEAILAVCIFHIGLPLDHPLIPVVERPKIAKRLSDLRERMMLAGYKYEIIHASPETGLEAFRAQLTTQPCDGVLIGGGVAGDPALSYFMEQIIDATHEVAPKAKIMFYNHSVDVQTIVERWFGSRSD